MSIGPHNSEAERQRVLAALVQDMPKPLPAPGTRPNWGSDRNRLRAYYLAACWGHSFTPTCTSCEADVWDVLRTKLREAEKQHAPTHANADQQHRTV